MAQLNYEIPDELHKALKREAVEQEITLKELIINLLAAGLDQTRFNKALSKYDSVNE